MTPEQREYLDRRAPYILREALALGVYTDAFGEEVRRYLDRHDGLHRDPLDRPESADELRMRD